ncbi:hypothetical protein OBBRIDRAFT_840092 [Obba rivulosa]|uniref:Uncharacterized protein n=1 Tax=Obba rivulosa TaxID=1052685 RepID=A0A8E2AGW4_9APHY|nr:hypothetical protein OBBRIDRAFT_840092 [Obba rivulosa]
MSDFEVYEPGEFAMSFLDSRPAYFHVLGIEIINISPLAATAFLLPKLRAGFQSLGGILAFPQVWTLLIFPLFKISSNSHKF